MKRFSLILAVLCASFHLQASTPEEIIASSKAFEADIHFVVEAFAEKCAGMTLTPENAPEIDALKASIIGNLIKITQAHAAEFGVCKVEDLAKVQMFSACIRKVSLENFSSGQCTQPTSEQRASCSSLQEVSPGCAAAFRQVLSEQQKTEL